MCKYHRFLSAFIAVFMLLSAFAGCSDGGNTADSTVSTENKDVTDTPDTDNNASADDILVSELADYKIVLPKYATSYMKMLADILKNDIKDVTGQELAILEESENGEKEILLGDTGTAESTTFHKELKIRDSGYKVVGKKILIAAPTANMLSQSVNAFMADVVDKISGDVFIKADQAAVIYGSYDAEVKNHTIGTLPMKGLFVLHAPDATQKELSKVQEMVKKLSTASEHYIFLRSTADTDWQDENVLYFGKKTAVRDLSAPASMDEDDVYIDHNANTVVYMYGDADHTMTHAVTLFDEEMRLAEAGAVSVAEEKHLSAGNSLRAMSFNVYYGNDSDQVYIDRVTTMIRNQMPDTLGLQEATQKWMDAISAALPEYAYVGFARSTEKENDEYSAIFYRKDKFDLIDSGTKWLSNTPDVPSKFNGAMLNRIMTYAILENKEDGTRFLHVNTHLDHKEESLRLMQMKVLYEQVEKLNLGKDMPIFFTGDFNSKPEGQEYQRFTEEYGYRDSSLTAIDSNRIPTFHNYNENTKKQSYIDYIFLNSNIEAETYRVLDQKINGEYSSDHHPIIATLWCYAPVGE